MPPKKSTSTPKGYSLHIGLNKISKQHYAGSDGALDGPEQDAKDMLKIAKAAGYEKSVILLSQKAKRQVVLDTMLGFAEALESGDIFFVSFSGHGGQVDDFNNEEADKLDETWCLYDGQLLDDEIHWCFSKFKKGVRIFAVIDSCHSGTNTKVLTLDTEVPSKRKTKALSLHELKKTIKKNLPFYNTIGSVPELKNVKRKIDASVIHIAACQDSELALDGAPNSLFTECLLMVWDDGNFEGSYGDFLNNIDDMIMHGKPNFLQYGKKQVSFSRSTPFTI